MMRRDGLAPAHIAAYLFRMTANRTTDDMVPTGKTLLAILVLSMLAACDARSNLDNFEYPPSSAYDSDEWPQLEPTAKLIQDKAALTPAQSADLANLSSRAAALRGKTQRLQTVPVTNARIASLKQRAAALRAFEF